MNSSILLSVFFYYLETIPRAPKANVNTIRIKITLRAGTPLDLISQ